jgi:excisionase family DNA binding protein
MATEFLTTTEAAARLGTTRQTVALYIRQRKIPAIKLGKAYRIPRQEFERLLQAPPPERQEPTQTS